MNNKMELILEQFISGLSLPPFRVNTNHFRDSMLKFAKEICITGMPFHAFAQVFAQRLFEELYLYIPNESYHIGVLIPKCLEKIKYYVDI